MTQSAARPPDPAVTTPGGGRDVARAVVRERRPEDLPALLTVLQRTHEEEGYPVRAGAVRSAWIAAPGELLGAVAVDGERVIGHVALHSADDSGSDSALWAWQQATGRTPGGLAVVSRFFTDRSVPGTGTVLLAHAEQGAAELGRIAVLQVDPESAARAFYQRRGWLEVGTAAQQWGHRAVQAVLMVPGRAGVSADGVDGKARQHVSPQH